MMSMAEVWVVCTETVKAYMPQSSPVGYAISDARAMGGQSQQKLTEEVDTLNHVRARD